MKKLMIWLFLALIGSGLSAAGTYAYLTDQDMAENEFGISENKIHIEEVFEPPDKPGPGSVIKKMPSIVNDSAVAVYVRVSVKFSTSAAEKICQPLVINEHWEKKSDGYYYYDKKLEAGSRTEALFREIVLKSDITQEQILPFDVLVYAESVQSCGFTQEEAWCFFGIGSEV